MSSQEEQIKNMSRAKATLKSKLTRFNNFLNNEVVPNLNSNLPLTEVEVLDVQSRLDRIQPFLLNEFEELQTKLSLLFNDEEYDRKLKELNIESEIFESSYFSSVVLAKKIINDHKNQNLLVTNIQQVGVSTVSSENDNRGDNTGLKPIDVPKFGGKYDEWLEFREIFSSLIHTNKMLPNIRKFHYLRGALQNEALQVIQAIEFSDSNYNTAWQVLCDRYDNDRLLIFRHVKGIFNLETIQKPSAEKIRSMIDSLNKHLRCLKQLNEPTEYWDTLLIYLLSQKLDSSTTNVWEQKKSSLPENPTLTDFAKFLKERANFLETMQVTREDSKIKLHQTTKTFYTENQARPCLFCNQTSHYIQNCDNFLKLSHGDKIEFIKNKRLCMCCLKPGHHSKVCRAKSCSKCRYKHHVILHLNNSQRVVRHDAENVPESNRQIHTTESNEDIHQAVVGLTANTVQQVLLSTVLVKVYDNHNQSHIIRCLLDNGSMSSFITKNLCYKLGLQTESIDFCVSGVNKVTSQINEKCQVEIKDVHSDYKIKLTCLVLPNITSNIPNHKIDLKDLGIPKSFVLADPSFHVPSKIDMLIGADAFWKILCVGQHNLGHNKPILQNTKLGWVVSGPLWSNMNTSVCNFVTINKNVEILDIQQQLTKFWALEECGPSPALSLEEKEAEEHFAKHTIRLPDGRFEINIPFKSNLSQLGNSFYKARRQFFVLEKRLDKNPTLKSNYSNYMKEFESLGFMRKLQNFSENEFCYVIPHHGVQRPESLTCPLRVVYNASMTTVLDNNSTGISLNDTQMVGPVVQDELLTILIRFRQYNYAVSADVSKMYCQISVNPEQRKYQRILWRSDSSENLSMYEMTRVVFGMASSPFLATRCLKQLALDCKESNPQISNIIEHGFYVDDFLSGGSTVEETISICNQVSYILKSACFQLRKWNSNSSDVINHMKNNCSELNCVQIGPNENAKMLGLIWSTKSDELKFKINFPADQTRITKRTVLSHIARIFDPLHLLAPCTIIAKMILQKIWLVKLSWDDSLPIDIEQTWLKFKVALIDLQNLSVSRQVVCKNAVLFELHAFADASQSAYGGAVYIKSVNNQNEYFVNLTCAKGKVAPLKTITIPKLELCAAVITARLVKRVVMSMDIKFNKIILWSDSTIVLGWLKMAPSMLKPFISNRVAEIQELTSNYEWRHVPTSDNPADLITRGVQPDQLKHVELWWHGPNFLKFDKSKWPVLPIISTKNLPDVKQNKLISLVSKDEFKFPFEHFSNLIRLKRVVALILRMFYNSKNKNKNNRKVGPLTAIELSVAMNILIKLSQRDSFSNEINKLLQVQSEKSDQQYFELPTLKHLSPFLDENEIMRVGGRLQNSNFDYHKIHPIILHSKHHLTNLIFRNEHLRLLHAGPQLMLASLREIFWPIRGRDLARNIVYKCVTCFRKNPKTIGVKMGNLPESRLRPGAVFEIIGVDYAGPFLIKDRKGRGGKISKCWMALFICFSTKAIHLELVTELSADCFLQAFRRFTARRGKPFIVYSDNGTNFVGAYSKLKELGNFLSKQADGIAEALAVEGVEWHFLPPSAPHFGGLWESGVKTCKYHLYRVMGEAHLTFEEFYTLLVQIEAVVNSRPLFTLSNLPSDPIPITPAHFLIGRPLTSLPDKDVTLIRENRLTTYERVQKLAQHFWERWSKEYVSELQVRHKWTKSTGRLKLNDVVLIKEDHVPVCQWRLGRIIELIPGKDGIDRVAIIKTSHGTTRRAFSKICPLPIKDEDSKQSFERS